MPAPVALSIRIRLSLAISKPYISPAPLTAMAMMSGALAIAPIVVAAPVAGSIS